MGPWPTTSTDFAIGLICSVGRETGRESRAGSEMAPANQAPSRNSGTRMPNICKSAHFPSGILMHPQAPALTLPHAEASCDSKLLTPSSSTFKPQAWDHLGDAAGPSPLAHAWGMAPATRQASLCSPVCRHGTTKRTSQHTHAPIVVTVFGCDSSNQMFHVMGHKNVGVSPKSSGELLRDQGSLNGHYTPSEALFNDFNDRSGDSPLTASQNCCYRTLNTNYHDPLD